MSIISQIVGRAWTGSGPVQRLIVDIEDGRISRVIPDELQARRTGALVLSEDALIVPGFHDAHLHFLFGGLTLSACQFAGVETVEEFSDVLSVCARGRKGGPDDWIRGVGLDETLLRVTRLDIDKVCPDIPVFIWSHDLHSAFVNSAALVRARIDGSVKDLAGGRFERDALGKLNGILRESAAQWVERAIPPVSPETARLAMLRAQEHAFVRGITAVSSSEHQDHILHNLNFVESSECKIRMNLWRASESFEIEHDMFERQMRTGFRFGTIKGFVDGALGSHTAAFWEPYADGGNGTPTVREGPLARYIRQAYAVGFQVAFHAIGDRANSTCLDAFEMAESAGRGPELRPRIEHVQHLRERDIPRFAGLGVIASMQPIHCTEDMRFVEPRLGAERARHSYAWRSLLDHGATLCFGSDWPVENLGPLAGIHAAVTRQDALDNPPGGWQPQERVSVAEALKAYTVGAAYAAFWEKDMGTLAEGKLADFTVFSKNIFECEPQEILKTDVRMTVVGGQVVFEANAPGIRPE
jgi:predicted amidohydrolase YtcJ